MKGKKIYVAGPYRGETKQERDDNVELAKKHTRELLRNGYYPYCPHTMTYDFENYCSDLNDSVFLNTHVEWLKCADTILLIGDWRESTGSVYEYNTAKKLGINTYESNGFSEGSFSVSKI